MDATEDPNQEPPKRASIPLWVGFITALVVWEVLPWAISLLSPRYGWTTGRPGPWNLLGLIPVLIGNIVLFLGIIAHSAETPGRIDFEPDKPYLLTHGLYRYSRNPMYVSELMLIVGWVIFYGNIALLIALVAWFLFFNYYQIPLEERVMEARFGEAFREYKNNVPRWFGKVRKKT